MEDIKITFCHKRKNSAKIWNVSLGAFRHLHNGIRNVYISYLVKMKHLHRLNELHPILKWRWIGWDKMLVKVNDVKLNTEIDNICCYIQSTCIWNVCIGVYLISSVNWEIYCKVFDASGGNETSFNVFCAIKNAIAMSKEKQNHNVFNDLTNRVSCSPSLPFHARKYSHVVDRA